MIDFHAWDDVIKPGDGDTDGFNDAPPGMFFSWGLHYRQVQDF